MQVKPQTLLSPKYFFAFSYKLQPILLAIFTVSLVFGTLDGLFFAPADYIQGEGYRILYVHVPCALLSLFVYGVMALCAVLILVFRLKLAKHILYQSAPLGASFTFLALVTGSLWGKPMWGTWWIWDARLTSELILLFLYLGILLFQASVAHKRHGDQAVAILTLVGFVDIPIIHFSVYWWNTLHQGATLKLFAPSTIDKTMLYPLLAMILAFISFYGLILILRIRYQLTKMGNNSHWLQEKKDVG